MESVSRQQGFDDPELDTGEAPAEFLYILNWFAELHAARGSGMGGVMPISYSDIISWRDLLQIDLHPFEVSILREIDNIYLSVSNEVTARELKRAKKK